MRCFALVLVASGLLSACATSSRVRSEGPPTASEHAWLEITTGHLVVRTNGSQDTALSLTVDAQRVAAQIVERFPCANDHLTHPIQVTLLVEDGAKPGVYRPPPSTLLDIAPRVIVGGTNPDKLGPSIIHELTHRLLATCLPRAPPWLHEGVAGYFQTATIEEGELVLGFPPFLFMDELHGAPVRGVAPASYRGRTVMIVPESIAPDLPSLLRMPPRAFYSKDALKRYANYAGAWTLVNMLMYGDEELTDRFGEFLSLVRTGTEPLQAWLSTFYDLDIEGRYDDRVRALNAPYYAVPIQTDLPRPELRKMSLAEGALVRAESYDWNTETGRKSARDWVDVAARNDTDSVSTALHYAAICAAASDLECARSHVSELEASHPSNPDVLAAAIRLRWRRPMSRREALELATNLEEHARSAFHHITSAALYISVNANRKAQQAAAAAISLDPSSWQAHMILAETLTRRGKFDAALDALRRALALSNHASEQSRREIEKDIVRVEAMQRQMMGGSTGR